MRTPDDEDPDGAPDDEDPNAPDEEDPEGDPDEEEEDDYIPDDDPDDGLDDENGEMTTLGELVNGIAFEFSDLEGEQTAMFVPQETAKYTFLATNAYQPSVTVTDENGTEILPLHSEETERAVCLDLQLQAGKTYIFVINATAYDYEYNYDSKFTLFIFKSMEQPEVGNNFFLQRNDSGERHLSFTVEESKVYFFSVMTASLAYYTPYVYFSVYEGERSVNTWFISSTGANQQVAAYLTEGVTYDLRLSLTNGYSYFFDAVYLNISTKVTEIDYGRNNVRAGNDRNQTWYSFTPSENGVYAIYSEGDYNTEITIYTEDGVNESAIAGASGENFLMRAVLRAGQTYYMKLRVYTDETWTKSFPVVIEKMSDYEAGENVVPVGEYETVYYPFTADQEGYYFFYADVVNSFLNTRTYLDSYVSQYAHALYLEKNQPVMLAPYNDTGTDHITFFVAPIDQKLDLGENTLTKMRDNHAYATFTPEVSGLYDFSVTCGSGYENTIIYRTNGDSLDKKKSSSDYKEFTYYLTAGEPYVLDMTLYSHAPEQVKVDLSLEDLPVLLEGKNTLSKDSPDRIFVFTPEKDGLYQIYNFQSSILSMSSDDYSYTRMYSADDYSYGFRSIAYEMKAGQQYTILVDYINDATLDLYVAKAPDLSEGTNQFTNAGLYTFVKYIPTETRIYGIGREGGGVNEIIVPPTTPTASYSTLYPTFFSNGKIFAILEKDATYIIPVRTGCTSYTTDQVEVTVTPDRTFEMGRNEHVLVENLQGYGSHYTYYSFVPEKSGTYIFRSEKNDGLFVDAILYKGLSGYQEFVHGQTSTEDGNMNLIATLEAGVIYRLAMFTDQSDQDLDIDLIVENAPAGNLSGYSLSLDGTIAVNLYMMLADYVVSSNTAVLKYTRANGTVVEYGIGQADVATVNNIEYYVFHLPIAAKEMTAELCAQIVDAENGIESEAFTFTAVGYARAILENAYDNSGHVKNQEYADAVPLVKALLNYASCAQVYFRFQESDLANDGKWMTDRDRTLGSVGADSVPGFVSSSETEQLPDGVGFYGASLTIESETALTFYFTNETGEELTFTSEKGVSIASRKSGGYTIVKVTGIPAHRLDENVRLNIRIGSDAGAYFVSYSPLNYCHNVLKRDETETRTVALKNLMKAFYFYNQAANNYIGED